MSDVGLLTGQWLDMVFVPVEPNRSLLWTIDAHPVEARQGGTDRRRISNQVIQASAWHNLQDIPGRGDEVICIFDEICSTDLGIEEEPEVIRA